jgi:outer membrane protein TolC
VQLGLSRNPALAEATWRTESLRHRIPQALALPDPVVNTTTQLAPVQTASGEQVFGLGISQKFTNRQRREIQAAIAREELRAAEAAMIRIRQEIAENIRIACYRLLFVRRAIEITEEDIQSLQQIAAVVQRQYEVLQSVSQQDVLNIRIELSRAENDMIALRQQEQASQARLARLIDLPPASELPIADSLVMPAHELSLEALTTRAIQMRPELAAQLATIRRDSNQLWLAGLQRRPDFTVGLNWIATSSSGISPVANGDDAVLLGVSFNLPVNKSRIRSAECEARAAREVSASRYESLQNEIVEEVFDLITRANSTRETLTLLQQDIIPNAQRTLDLSINEYVNGDVQYVQLIENWRSLLRYRLTESRLISEYNQITASLSRSIGDLTPLAGSPAMSSPQP